MMQSRSLQFIIQALKECFQIIMIQDNAQGIILCKKEKKKHWKKLQIENNLYIADIYIHECIICMQSYIMYMCIQKYVYVNVRKY